MTPPTLLAVVEVAERLNVDRSVVRKLVAAGRLTPAMKLPGATGAYLFTESEVERFVAERRAS